MRRRLALAVVVGVVALVVVNHRKGWITVGLLPVPECVHEWEYFIDGHLCRVCVVCRTPEYDVPWPADRPCLPETAGWMS